MRVTAYLWFALLSTLSSASPESPAAETVVGQQAEKHGFSTCSRTVDKLAKFLVDENEYDSHATWGRNKPDTRLFNSQIGIRYKDGNAVEIVNVAPTKDGKCDSSYTTIFPMTKPCAVLRETDLKNWKFYRDSAGLVTLQNDSGRASLILLPVGTGCVSIKTEVIHE